MTDFLIDWAPFFLVVLAFLLLLFLRTKWHVSKFERDSIDEQRRQTQILQRIADTLEKK